MIHDNSQLLFLDFRAIDLTLSQKVVQGYKIGICGINSKILGNEAA